MALIIALNYDCRRGFFKLYLGIPLACVAQLVERSSYTRVVPGSSPGTRTSSLLTPS